MQEIDSKNTEVLKILKLLNGTLMKIFQLILLKFS